MQLKEAYKKYYFEGNYNCAECIIRAANDVYELGLHDHDMKLMGVYGAGIQCGNTCGAVLATAAVLSMKYVEAKAHESADIKPVTVLLLRKFKERYGSTLCKDIKPQSFKPEYRCKMTVETAIDILEATIAEYEEKRSRMEA